MQFNKWLCVTILTVLFTKTGWSQQLRLGNNPWTVEKSAVLELQSANQGLLFSRIADTALINTLAPPDGMVIYFTPAKQLMLRANGYWQPVMTPGKLSAGTGISYSNTTGVIGNTGVLSVNGNSGALTMDTGYIANFYQKVRGLFSASAPLTLNNGQIGITQATTSTNGYLSSADWNTFNNKLSTVDTSSIASFYLKSRSELSAGTGISYNNTTGVIGNTGVLSVNGNSGALTMDTGYIANFYQKVRGLFSASAPLTLNNGQIGITQATTSTNGYLSSADWNTFNNKLSTVDTSNIAGFWQKVRGELSAGTGISYNNTTGVISNGGVTSVNGNTGALTMDTTFIGNFYQKVRGLFSAGSGISYNATTGVITNSGAGGSGWALGGNTVGALKTLGTIDAYDLPIITGNAERMRISSTGNVGIGTSTFDAVAPERLLIDGGVSSSYNLLIAQGSRNGYLQFNLTNNSTGGQASSDIVATANNGTETTNYIDMGINGGGYNSANNILSGPDNGYLYSAGNDFMIGNSSTSKDLVLFSGGIDIGNERMRLTAGGNVGIGTYGSTPQAMLDVNGSYKLGSGGTVLNKMIKSSFTLSDATNFNNTSTLTLTASVSGATTNGTVIINPRTALPAGVGIAWSRVSGSGTVTIAFTNTSSTNTTLGTVTFDVTVIQ